jgi:hypothetical protein
MPVLIVVNMIQRRHKIEERARRITIQDDISDDFIRRIARLYELNII